MKPMDMPKAEKKQENAADPDAQETVEVKEEAIDFSNVQIEPMFSDFVDFETFSKSDFRAVKVLA